MATKDDTTTPHHLSNQPASDVSDETPVTSTHDPDSPPPIPTAVEHAIEVERACLLQAHSVMSCLYEVLLHAECDDVITYAGAAYVSARLIDESVERLDVVRLRVLAKTIKEDSGGPQQERGTEQDPNSTEEEDRPAYSY